MHPNVHSESLIKKKSLPPENNNNNNKENNRPSDKTWDPTETIRLKLDFHQVGGAGNIH